MKRISFTAILAAVVMLTGCASQNNTAVLPLESSMPETAPVVSGDPGTSAVTSTAYSGTSGTASGSSAAHVEDTKPSAPESTASVTSAVSAGSIPEETKPETVSSAATAATSTAKTAAKTTAGTTPAEAPSETRPARTTAAIASTASPAEVASPAETKAPEHSDPVGEDYKGTDIGGTGISDDYLYDMAESPAEDGGFFAEADIAFDAAPAISAGGAEPGAGFAESPVSFSCTEEIEFPYTEEIEPEIPPEAGLLTGGEWNDNDHWDFWEGLYSSNNYGVDWSGYREEWRTGLECRAAVTVTDSSGAPVSGAEVQGIGYSAVTDNKGRAYLFCKESQLVNGPSEFTVTYNGGSQTFSGIVGSDSEFTFTLDGEATPAAKTLDLMIMCDTTGSMGDELEYLKAELEDVVTRIKQENANIPVRISVNFYRDEGDEYVVREFPFTTDLDAAVRAISEQSADGGGDTPEAVHTALDSAVNSHDWGEDSIKVMFLVLDAPPHGDVQIIDEVVKHTRTAAEKGIRVVPVAASGVDKSCEYLLRSMAIMTGGTYTFLTDDSGIGYSHTEPTIGAYDVEKLNDMMVRIAGEYIG